MSKDSSSSETDNSTAEHKKSIPFWLQLLLCCLSGTMLSACFPGMGNQAFFVFLWSLPLFYSLYTLSPKRRGLKGFLLGYSCGLTFWLLNLKWLLKMGDLSYVAPAAATLGWFLLPAYLAVYFGIFGFILAKWANPWLVPKPKVKKNRIDEKLAKKLNQEPAGRMAQSFKESIRCLQYALLHASLWAILEWLRSIVITGFPWNGLGAALYGIPVLAQTAELVGVIALSFFPMFFTSVLFQLVARMIKEAAYGKMKPHWDMGVAGLILAGMFGFGVLRLYELSDAEKGDFGVVLVQQNISQAEKYDNENHVSTIMNYAHSSEEGIQKVEKMNAENFNKHQQDGTLESFQDLKVDAIVWPESTLFWGIRFSEESQTYRLTEIEGTALENTFSANAPMVITGCNEYHFKNDSELEGYTQPSGSYNSILIARNNDGVPSFAPDTVYKKNHLVMFGEYIPFRETFPFLEKIIGGAEGVGPNFLPGTSDEPITIQHQGKDLQFIGSICFEDSIGRVTRKFVRQAPQIIINSTNDGWFGQSEAPMQHMINASFRCIELRRPMIRSANTGVSCVINVKGSFYSNGGKPNAILDEKGSPFISGTLYAKASYLLDGRLTLYAIAGDWFIILCSIIFVTLLIPNLKKTVA